MKRNCLGTWDVFLEFSEYVNNNFCWLLAEVTDLFRGAPG